MKISCPTCQTSIKWSDQYPDRPFCSNRCRLIDLGEWASERHALPGRPATEELLSEQLNMLEKDSALH